MRLRSSLILRLSELFYAWGYEPLGLPALELHSEAHPQAARAFKLVDKNGHVLALRSEFTTAVSEMVKSDPPIAWPARYQYAGPLWLRETDSELGRMREYTQAGLELIGISTPEADAEVLELAFEALVTAGLADARIEVGLPSFVRDLLEATRLGDDDLAVLQQAVDQKNTPELASALRSFGMQGRVYQALLALPDLYGDQDILAEAEAIALSERARIDLQRLKKTLSLLSPHHRPLLDLGMARRYEYYTGLTFRAYTRDFGLPLLGGGRYGGSGTPFAIGFALGLERVQEALGETQLASPPEILALDWAQAARLRGEGRRVELAWTDDREELMNYARLRGVRYLATNNGLLEVSK